MNTTELIKNSRQEVVDNLVQEIYQLRKEMNERYAKIDQRFDKITDVLLDLRLDKMERNIDKIKEKLAI